MNKKLFIFILALTLLLNPINIYAQNETLPQDPSTEVVEIPPEEVRNQNFLVPTAKGIQKGNLREAKIIENLEKKSLKELSQAYLLGDFTTGEILEEYDIDKVVGLASTSKLVAVYVILDKINAGEISLEDKVIIDRESSLMVGSSYKLKEHDELTVKELLESTMVISANDSITALGKFVAGSSQGFVSMMNKKCKELGLTTAHMVNCTGLTNYETEEYNKMSTRDLFTLTTKLIKDHPEIIELSTKTYLIEKDKNIEAYNTNPIMGIVPQIDGLKTGYTNIAGRCLVTTGLKKSIPNVSKELRLVGLIMGSKGDWARFVAAKKLMTDGFEKYSNKILADTEKPVETLEIKDAVPESTSLYPLKSTTILYNEKKAITKTIELDPPKLPISPGEVVGKITYYLDGVEAYSTDLVTKEKIKDQNIIHKFRKLYQAIFENIEKAA